ncbi:MAG: transposon-transfer assisting family protein [Oscillospiraceae bacterium]|nr:transposon-transfer assisting family protein [Oscillospiraceae bacterium]
MDNFTFEERNLVCIYNSAGTRTGLIAALKEMSGYLEADEKELRELTDSALSKLGRMTDAEYDALDLFPDFDTEDAAYGG